MKTKNQVVFSEICDFRAEHREAERHYKGQYNKSEFKGLLRTYKSQNKFFEAAARDLAYYGEISKTTIPPENLLRLWWTQI